MKLTIILFFCLFSSSAGAEPFFSHSAQALDKSRFKITITQDIPRVNPKICPNEDLLMIAVAEECENRNFKYFDVGVIDSKTALGFCFQSDQRRLMGIAFAEINGQLFVKNLNKKNPTELRIKDKISSVLGERVASIGELKGVLAQKKVSQMDMVELQIERDGKNLQILEPITMKNQANSSVKSVWAARSTCQDNMPPKYRTLK